MHCPVCNSLDTKVVDSRSTSAGLSVRRRRECPKCNYRFSTYEYVELLGISVLKTDGRREAYSQEKLERGIKKALEKRPYAYEDFQRMVTRIEQAIQKLKKQEIPSQLIGEMVMKQLKKFDKVAYIRFASIYKSFEDMETFQREVKSLIGKRKRKK